MLKIRYKTRAAIPVIGVILLVGVFTALIAFSSVMLFDNGFLSSEDPDVQIEIRESVDSKSINILSNSNVDEFILRTPNGNETYDYTTESIELNKNIPGQYTLITKTDDTETIIERFNIDGEYETIQGQVSTNPEIENAEIYSIIDGQILGQSETDEDGEYTIQTPDIENTTITVNVEGFTSDELSYPLYAGAKKKAEGNTNLDFTFTNESERNVNDKTIITSYEVLEAENKNAISNIKQLQAIDTNQDYSIARNIYGNVTDSWNGGEGFIPIDNYSGNINGNSFTISNIHMRTSTDNEKGLFRSMEGSEIKNLTLSNFDIKHEEESSGGNRYGILVGQTDGETNIKNIGIENSIIESSDNDIIGGIVGRNNGVIESSYVIHTDIYGNENVGGLIGSNGGTEDEGMVKKSYVQSEIFGSNNVGGLIGNDFSSSSISIYNSYSASVINPTGEQDNYYGAISGQVSSSIDGSNIYWDYERADRKFEESLDDAGSGDYSDINRLTTSEMTGHSPKRTMRELDFENIWDITREYPSLQNQKN